MKLILGENHSVAESLHKALAKFIIAEAGDSARTENLKKFYNFVNTSEGENFFHVYL